MGEDVLYLHPLLEPIVKETYGIMIYQEQVMQAAQALAGYGLGGADLLRRAMGKKLKEEMDKQKALFVEGAAENKISEKKALEIFTQIEAFAGYGFNKSPRLPTRWCLTRPLTSRLISLKNSSAPP